MALLNYGVPVSFEHILHVLCKECFQTVPGLVSDTISTPSGVHRTTKGHHSSQIERRRQHIVGGGYQSLSLDMQCGKQTFGNGWRVFNERDVVITQRVEVYPL